MQRFKSYPEFSVLIISGDFPLTVSRSTILGPQWWAKLWSHLEISLTKKAPPPPPPYPMLARISHYQMFPMKLWFHFNSTSKCGGAPTGFEHHCRCAFFPPYIFLLSKDFFLTLRIVLVMFEFFSWPCMVTSTVCSWAAGSTIKQSTVCMQESK